MLKIKILNTTGIKLNYKSTILATAFFGVFFASIFRFDQVKAQSDAKSGKYKIWINQTDGGGKFKGVLLDVKDSSLLFSLGFSQFHYSDVNKSFGAFDYKQIRKMKVRKKGRIGRGIFFGALGGCTIGAIRGVVEGDDPIGCSSSFLSSCPNETAGEKAIKYGFTYAWIGGIAGAIVGSFKIKIPIDGQKNKFVQERERLREYVYHQSSL